MSTTSDRSSLVERADAVHALGLIVGLVLIGAPIGLVWAAAAPHLNYVNAENGEFSAYGVTAGADAVFTMLSLGVGVVVGVGVAGVRRLRGVGAPVGLGVGAFLAASVAARVGQLTRSHGLHQVLAALSAEGVSRPVVAAFGQSVGFQTRGWIVLVVLPFAALLGYAVRAARYIGAPTD
ncbi:MAG: hypothetical protein ACYDB7_14445 [Mycobacteriales bacterium]